MLPRRKANIEVTMQLCHVVNTKQDLVSMLFKSFAALRLL
jgi:hypothetical protein